MSMRPRMLHASARHVAVLFTLLVAAAGCNRCGKSTSEAVQVAHYVPSQVQAAVVVPDLAALGERLRLLESLKLASFAAQLQGLPNAQAFGDAVARQAGVDVRSPESLKAAGIAPDRGFAVAVLSDSAGYFVVGVQNEAAFADTMKRLAADRLGARQVQEGKTPEGLRHVWFTREGSTRHELGYVLRDGLALVSTGAMAEKLPEWSALPKARSLGEDARFRASLEQLPQKRDVIVHLPLGEWTKKGGPGFTAVAHLDKTGLFIHGDAPWPDTRDSLAALEAQEGGADQTRLLPEDAFVVARFRGDPKALKAVLPVVLGTHLRRAFAMAGVDLDEVVLKNLQPGTVASLSVSPEIRLSGGMPELDVRRTNPFRFAHLVGFAQPQRPDEARALLARMPEVAPRFGARIEPVEQEGRTLYVTRYAQGEGVHLSQTQDGRIVFASPLARLEQTLGRLGSEAHKGPPLLAEPSLRTALDAHALSVVVDLNQLRESVRALPADAWGIGGFAMKASALRWLEATDDLRAITFGASRAKDSDSVRTELALRFTQR